jgi:tetratricopeptide (TPR) repeat protein
MSIQQLTTTVDTQSVLDLCEAGRYREAAGVLEYLDPAERPLAFGMVETARGNQEAAKDFLSRCVDERAITQLAIAYWRSGEVKEARDILKTAPKSFERLLYQAIIETETAPAKALDLLEQAAAFSVPPGSQARLHNQRAIALRKLRETDRAIQEYDAAIHYFTEAKSDCLPLVLNNFAGIYLDCGLYADAHSRVDDAIGLLGNDPSHLAKAYDQKALIYLAEGKLDQARNYANKAVGTIERTDKKAWLAEFLITRAKILSRAGETGSSLIALDRAGGIGEYLNNDQVSFDVANLKAEIAQALVKESDMRRIALALQMAGTLRGAARKLGLNSVQHLIKIMDRYYMDRPRRSRSIR